MKRDAERNRRTASSFRTSTPAAGQFYLICGKEIHLIADGLAGGQLCVVSLNYTGSPV
jgi:hypothetical protein